MNVSAGYLRNYLMPRDIAAAAGVEWTLGARREAARRSRLVQKRVESAAARRRDFSQILATPELLAARAPAEDGAGLGTGPRTPSK